MWRAARGFSAAAARSCAALRYQPQSRYKGMGERDRVADTHVLDLALRGQILDTVWGSTHTLPRLLPSVYQAFSFFQSLAAFAFAFFNSNPLVTSSSTNSLISLFRFSSSSEVMPAISLHFTKPNDRSTDLVCRPICPNFLPCRHYSAFPPFADTLSVFQTGVKLPPSPGR